MCICLCWKDRYVHMNAVPMWARRGGLVPWSCNLQVVLSHLIQVLGTEV